MPFPRTMWFSLAAILFLLTSNSCSNDPASAGDGGQPPALPDRYSFQRGPVSFFDHEVDYTDEDYSYHDYIGFFTARTWAELALDRGDYDYFPIAANTRPEYQDGVWVWGFLWSDAEEEEGGIEGDASAFLFLQKRRRSEAVVTQLTHRLTARSVTDGTEWVLTISGVIGDHSFNDVLLEEGFVSDDGMEGKWKHYLFDFNEISLFQESEWKLESETALDLHITQYREDVDDPDIIKTRMLHYRRDGNDNRVSTNDGNDVWWNLETGEGWALVDGSRVCFSRENDYRNIPCNNG